MKQETYKNGQPAYRQDGDILTYFYEDGGVRAKGQYINEMMEGEWIFNRKSGQLWQIGHFLHNQKHGSWIRFNKDGEREYEAMFEENKVVKKIL